MFSFGSHQALLYLVPGLSDRLCTEDHGPLVGIDLGRQKQSQGCQLSDETPLSTDESSGHFVFVPGGTKTEETGLCLVTQECWNT